MEGQRQGRQRRNLQRKGEINIGRTIRVRMERGRFLHRGQTRDLRCRNPRYRVRDSFSSLEIAGRKRLHHLHRLTGGYDEDSIGHIGHIGDLRTGIGHGGRNHRSGCHSSAGGGEGEGAAPRGVQDLPWQYRGGKEEALRVAERWGRRGGLASCREMGEKKRLCES